MDYDHVENPSAYGAAVRRNIINNARKTFMRNNPRAGEAMEWIWNHQERSRFAASLQGSLDSYGKLTPKQLEAVLKIIDGEDDRKKEREAKRLEIAAKSKHIGEVGQRIVVEGFVEAIIEISKPQFSRWDCDTTNIYKIRDKDGNMFCVKHIGLEVGGRETPDGEYAFKEFEVGHRVQVKGTIKQFDEYKGENQTWLFRPIAQKVTTDTGEIKLIKKGLVKITQF